MHHDRRLHQLMLLEASKEWARSMRVKGLPTSTSRSIKPDAESSADRRISADSFARTSSSPTDSVSSLHDTLLHDFRCPQNPVNPPMPPLIAASPNAAPQPSTPSHLVSPITFASM